MSEDHEIVKNRNPEAATDSFITKCGRLAGGIVGAEIGVAVGYSLFKALGIDYPDLRIMVPAVVAGGVTIGLALKTRT